MRRPKNTKSASACAGTVTRVADFGAFVELEPGIEGLIHISEMSWAKKVRKPSDVVKPGETVEAVILAVNPGERRISLGLKQALGDPWAEVPQRFAVGSVIEGPVTSLTKFGAFVQLAEGVEGMIHVSEISAEKRINHPQDVLKVGQVVKAQVLEVDTEKRLLRLEHEATGSHQPGRIHRRTQGRRRGHRPHDRGFRRTGARGTGRRHPGHVPHRRASVRAEEATQGRIARRICHR